MSHVPREGNTNPECVMLLWGPTRSGLAPIVVPDDLGTNRRLLHDAPGGLLSYSNRNHSNGQTCPGRLQWMVVVDSLEFAA